MRTSLLVMTCVMLAAALAFSDRFVKDSPDKAFVLTAADGGMLEVKLGELATKNASMPKCKEFGKMMIKDHTKVNDELKALASKKQVMVPAELSATKQQMYDSLAALSGEQFDMLYMNMMTAFHEETIGLFNRIEQGTRSRLQKMGRFQNPRIETSFRNGQSIVSR